MNGARPPSHEGERRQATVLFADLSGFTALSERTDPEETRRIINRCFERLERVVRDHGGHVDKYMGDAIMALFGVPQAMEHTPRQAVNAAIEMRNAVKGLREEERFPVPLDIHIGINTGLVLAGEVGGEVRRDFTVTGDTVNLASRLTGAAPTGSIYVGPETYRHTRHEFEYRTLEPLTLKGKEKPVTAYELLSSRERIYRPRPARAERMIGSEMVGRAHELANVRAVVRAVAEGRGGIATVIGEAGLGKSRLMAEAMALPEMGAVTLLEGRSLSMSQGLAFHPFTDLLRAWAGIVEDDGEQQSFSKLEAAVAALLGDKAGEVIPPIAALMGMRLTGVHAARLTGVEGESLERLIMRSMRELVGRMAAARPLVLVFEDLHWADLSSRKLLEFLLHLVPDAPVLFVLVSRPDPAVELLLKTARQQHGQHLIDIALQPLSERDCRLLIWNLLKTEDVPHSLVRKIASKAEGNPFYIEEVVRTLIDQDVIDCREGVFRVTGDIDAISIPATIEGVIMARVDRLPPQARHLLQLAAVIGRRLPHRLLTAVSGREEEIELSLRHLGRSQLLEESRTAHEIEHVFKHALVQETVYGSILHGTRKQIHDAVARSIESLYAERLPEFYGMLAYHYSRAEDLEKAEDYLFKAGDEAARSAAPSEALRYFREASRLYFLLHGEGGDPWKKALLERNIARALFHTGNLIESVEHFDKSLTLLGEAPRTGRLAIVLGFLADLAGLLWWLYVPIRLRRPRMPTDVDRAAHAIRYNRGLAQMTSDPKRYFVDATRMVRCLNRLDPSGIEHAPAAYAGAGALFAYSGISFAITRRFLAVAERLVEHGDAQDRFFYQTMRFVYDYLAGNWQEDRAIAEELVDEALRRGQVWDTFVYRGLDSERRAHRGDFVGAARQIERLRELSDIYGFYVARSNEYAMSAVLLVEQRQLERAREMADLYYATQDEENFHLFAFGTRAKIEVLTGNREGAAETLAQAAALLQRVGRGNAYHVSVVLTARLLHDVESLEAALDLGQRPAALVKSARRNARVAVRMAHRVARERVEVFRLTGTLYWLLRKHRRALLWWRRSIASGRVLGARPELARTCAEIGRRLGAAGAHPKVLDSLDAASYVALAKGLYDEIGLGWDGVQPVPASGLRAAG